MCTSFKSLRYTTAIAVSLVALSTANQAHAQCAPGPTGGNDTITCTNSTNNLVLNQGGSDSVTVNLGADIETAGGGTVLNVVNSSGFTLVNDGIIRRSGATPTNDTLILTTTNTGTADVSITNRGDILNNDPGDGTGTQISAAIQIGQNTFDTFSLTNSGLISSGRETIIIGAFSGSTFLPVDYNSSTVINQTGGQILAIGSNNNALFLGNGNDTIINEVGATIDGNINFAGGNDDFTNHGTLLDVTTLDLGDGNDMLTNTSLITANVVAGDGDDTITNEVGGVISAAAPNNVGVITTGNGNDNIINNGTITATAASGVNGQTIRVDGTGIKTITNTGTIEQLSTNGASDTIVVAPGLTSLTLTNTGDITNVASSTGVDSAIQTGNIGTATINITNSGNISGEEAIDLGGGSLVLVNESGGQITSTVHAIEVNSGNDNSITNEAGAEITGDIIVMGGDDTITNDGTITGDIDFGSGANNVITNTGDIISNFRSLEGTGDFTLTNSSNIINDGASALLFTSGIGDVVNSGRIEATASSSDLLRYNTIGNRAGESITITNQVGGELIHAGTGVGSAAIEFGNGTLGSISVMNDGVIDSSGRAIRFEGATLDTAIINNTGSITSALEAIRNTTNAIDLVTNSGDITGDIDTFNGDDVITNNAGATITGEITPGNGDDTITNSGTINGRILIDDDTGSDTIINNEGGLIEDLGTGDSVDIPIRIVNSSADSIYNAGIIRANQKAIRLQNDSDLTGGFLNDTTGVIIGDLNGDFTGGDPGSSAFEITPGSDISGGFENRGSIIHNTGTGVNIGVPSGGEVTGAIVNSGTITGGLNGIDFDGSSSADFSGGITNSGTIEGATGSGIALPFAASDIDISGGIINQADGVIIGNFGIGVVGTDNSISGGINNSGTIEGTGGTAINLSGLGAVTPITINGGRIIGDVTDSNIASGRSPVTVTGSGFRTEGNFNVSSLTVNSGEDFTISATDTVTIQAMPNSAGGIFRFEVADALTAGKIDVQNGAVNIDGATIVADVIGNLSDNDEVLIGTGSGAVIGLAGGTGQVLESIDDNSILFDFGIADGGQTDITTAGSNANELYLLVNRGSIEDIVGGSNNQNSGGGLDGLLASGNGGNLPASVLANINNASTVEELEAVVDATLPQVDGASLSAAQNVTNNTIRLVSDRLTTIRGGSGASGISSGDLTENLQMWGQVFGQIVSQGERKGVAGYDADTYGTTIGADTEGLYDGATVGLAVSYANTDVDSDNATNTQSDIDSYNVTLYGDYDLSDDSFIVGDIGYTYGDNETTRFNVGGAAGLNARSDYDSHQIQARVIVGKDYHSEEYEGLHITPKAQVRYTHYRAEDIEETGAGGANLNVDSESLNILELGVGVDVRKDYVQENGGVLSPEFSAGYRYDVIGDAVETTSTFAAGGPSFRTEGADPDQDTFNFGLGVGYTSPSSMEFTASYDYESKDEFNGHSAFLRAAMPF